MTAITLFLYLKGRSSIIIHFLFFHMGKRISTKARLILEDGAVFEGLMFGYKGASAGEVVFNTAMTGYPESLTDPSYEGQILVTTYPLQGNYGVPPEQNDKESGNLSKYLEGDHIHVRGLVVQDYSWNSSHWQSSRTLDEWLREQKVPGLYGVDTRALTKHLRSHGSMLGKIVPDDCDSESVDWYDPNKDNLVALTSCDEVTVYDVPDASKTVILVDCGVKHNIVRCLTRRGVKVIRVPWNYDYTDLEFDGVFLSNGPGNPGMVNETVEILRKVMATGKPICGICMGNQLLARAAGAETYKLKYGHRSHNQPVRKAGTDTCFVTSQNHGFAVDTETLPSDWEPLFINMNDGTNEGIKHKSKPFFSAQFHPEASSGPKDTEFLFDDFISLL